MSEAEKVRERVGDLALRVVRGMEMHPFDINNGYCDTFADLLLRRVEEEGDLPEADMETSEDYNDLLPGHVWLTVGRLHFDAEEPYGVDDPMKLPIFMRFFLETGAITVPAAEAVI